MNTIYRYIPDTDWMTIILLFGLLLLAAGRSFFGDSFKTFLVVPFSNSYFALSKKKSKMVRGFHWVLCLFQILNVSLFVVLITTTLLDTTFAATPKVFGIILAGLAVFLTLKVVLQMGNGLFFDNQGLMTDIIFQKLTFFNYGGLISFVGNIFLIFIFQGNTALVYLMLFFLVLINGIGLVHILRNYQNLIVYKKFYFILYLCTLEIAPLAILISYINSWIL
ncbi:MAG: DUF4271 domain-containing protein [Bacteroidota bacterium]